MDDMRLLLKKAGYPEFDLDSDGFPLAGPVIRYFRERMTYMGTEGKQRHWTQVDLAKRLRVSEVSVRLMETKNTGLDSISRRRVLADMLNIPPVLLGLGSLTTLTEFLRGNTIQSAMSTARHVVPETVTLYQDAARIYGELHLTSTAQGSLDQLNQWITRIHTDIQQSRGDLQITLQDILWTFYDLTAKVYSDDLNNWEMALRYLNEEMSIAESLKSDELRAASLYRSGQIRFAQRQYSLAKSDLDGALVFAKSPQVNPQLKSAVFASASLAHAIVDKDEQGRKYAQTLIHQSGTVITNLKQPEDTRFVKFDYGKYLLEYADVLIALGRPVAAMNILDDATDEIDPSMRRRHAYINILQAVANLRSKTPRYDVATDLLSGAFAVSRDIKSSFNIGQITKYYQELKQSPYANATDVADLGISLREWHKQR